MAAAQAHLNVAMEQAQQGPDNKLISSYGPQWMIGDVATKDGHIRLKNVETKLGKVLCHGEICSPVLTGHDSGGVNHPGAPGGAVVQATAALLARAERVVRRLSEHSHDIFI